MIIVLLEPAFLFFVLTSGRPLPVTTKSAVLSLSKGFPLQPKFAAAAAQRFYSSFVALLEAILQQRCSFRTGVY